MNLVIEAKEKFGAWNIILVVVIMAILLGGYVAWPSMPDTARLIQEERARLTKEHQQALLEKEKTIKDGQGKIQVLNVQIQASKGQYARLMEAYKKLQEAQANVQPAQTDTELRDRFIARGIVPVAADQHGPGIICFSTERGR